MKRVVKKGNNKRMITRKYQLVFVFVFVLYLASSILLKNYNIDLSHQLQTIQRDNTQLQSVNQTLKMKIDDLSSFERMSSIAKENGLKNREGSIKNVE